MFIDFRQRGGKEPVVEALSVTENGTYTPKEGIDGFAPVDVNVAGGPTKIKVVFRVPKFNTDGTIMYDTTPEQKSLNAEAYKVFQANYKDNKDNMDVIIFDNREYYPMYPEKVNFYKSGVELVYFQSPGEQVFLKITKLGEPYDNRAKVTYIPRDPVYDGKTYGKNNGAWVEVPQKYVLYLPNNMHELTDLEKKINLELKIKILSTEGIFTDNITIIPSSLVGEYGANSNITLVGNVAFADKGKGDLHIFAATKDRTYTIYFPDDEGNVRYSTNDTFNSGNLSQVNGESLYEANKINTNNVIWYEKTVVTVPNSALHDFEKEFQWKNREMYNKIMLSHWDERAAMNIVYQDMEPFLMEDGSTRYSPAYYPCVCEPVNGVEMFSGGNQHGNQVILKYIKVPTTDVSKPDIVSGEPVLMTSFLKEDGTIGEWTSTPLGGSSQPTGDGVYVFRYEEDYTDVLTPIGGAFPIDSVQHNYYDDGRQAHNVDVINKIHEGKVKALYYEDMYNVEVEGEDGVWSLWRPRYIPASFTYYEGNRIPGAPTNCLKLGIVEPTGGRWNGSAFLDEEKIKGRSRLFAFDGTKFGGENWNSFTFDLNEEKANEKYQSKLYSGQNIKTINGNEILGSGDLELKAEVQGVNVIMYEKDFTETLHYFDGQPDSVTEHIYETDGRKEHNAKLFASLSSEENCKTFFYQLMIEKSTSPSPVVVNYGFEPVYIPVTVFYEPSVNLASGENTSTIHVTYAMPDGFPDADTPTGYTIYKAKFSVDGSILTDWVATPIGGGSGSGIEDAPADGKLYGRQDGAWTEVQSGGSTGNEVFITVPDFGQDGSIITDITTEQKQENLKNIWEFTKIKIAKKEGIYDIIRKYPNGTPIEITYIAPVDGIMRIVDITAYSHDGSIAFNSCAQIPEGGGSGSGIPEPPGDGRVYGRRVNKGEPDWIPIPGALEGMVPEAPDRATPYCRMVTKGTGEWVEGATKQYVDDLIGTVNNELNLI